MLGWFVVILFLACFIFVLGSIIWWSLNNGISPMPSSCKAKRCILAGLPENVNGKIYELGSGWGTLVFCLAKRYPACQIVGYETSLLPYWCSRIWCLLAGYRNVTIIRKDFYEVGLSDARLVVCYLYPGAMLKLKDKFEQELASGTWVISSTFSIPGWKAFKIDEVKDLYFSKVYVYRCKS